MVIKAKMPNDAWLGTITDSTAAKFRGRLQLKGPFTATAVRTAVLRCHETSWCGAQEIRALCRAAEHATARRNRHKMSPFHIGLAPRCSKRAFWLHRARRSGNEAELAVLTERSIPTHTLAP